MTNFDIINIYKFKNSKYYLYKIDKDTLVE